MIRTELSEHLDIVRSDQEIAGIRTVQSLYLGVV